MEIFRSDVLKREYREFVNDIQPTVIKCDYCNIDSYKWHNRLNISCNLCREQRCSICFKFNLTRNFLMQNADDIGKTFLYNFILVFLNISDESLNFFTDIER